MLLDDLQTLIETLRERITKHGSALSKSEALTRYALIDPLLRELGWDTTDPEHVLVEYPLPKGAKKGFADYALMGAADPPRVIVEAKSLHSPLDDAAAQALGYCNVLGIPYFAVSDGERWLLYETFQPVPLPDKLVVRLNLSDSPPETCLRALALWRPSVADGHVQVGATPVVPTHSTESPTPGEPSQTDGAVDEIDGDGWHALSEFRPAAGSKPAAIKLPSGDVQTTGNYADLSATVVRWLHETDHLKKSHLPIQRTSNSYIVATTAHNPNGKRFAAKRLAGPYFVNVNFAGEAHARNIRFVIKTTGLDPADFAVRLAK